MSVPSPEEIVKSVEAGILAERKRLSEARQIVATAQERIKKAEKLLRVLRSTFGLKVPEPAVVSVVTTPKPGGILVIDPELECPMCGFQAGNRPGLSQHTKFKHGWTWEETLERMKVDR
jgi:hypothetical protein